MACSFGCCANLAALLVADQGKLPHARHALFDHYFDTIFKRELGKPFEHGIQSEDKPLLRALHAHAGLVLHSRSQEQAGARPTLSPRELRGMLAGIFEAQGYRGDELQAKTDRMMRFASERLVLILRMTDGGYSFGIRSLQEFFAAQSLVEGDRAEVRQRLEAIALNPHWSNVLALVTSRLALRVSSPKAQLEALEWTAGICSGLNEGRVGGEAAAACFMGSRLAVAMLRETEGYGRPKFLKKGSPGSMVEPRASPVIIKFVPTTSGASAN